MLQCINCVRGGSGGKRSTDILTKGEDPPDGERAEISSIYLSNICQFFVQIFVKYLSYICHIFVMYLSTYIAQESGKRDTGCCFLTIHHFCCLEQKRNDKRLRKVEKLA